MDEEPSSGYGLSHPQSKNRSDIPPLDYGPPRPRHYHPAVALIGAGGISEYHLRAYRRMGLNVAVICDLQLDRAQERQRAFYPSAHITTDVEEAIHWPGVEVIDAATHPEQRLPILELSLEAGKHVLSQKPFVLDLRSGERLVELAQKQGVCLAVNHNGRYAPHFRFLQRAISNGWIGELASLDFILHWDHTWTESTPFNEIHHLLLFDFAIHWFDMIHILSGVPSAQSVYASVRRTKFQTAKPPFLAHAVLDFENLQARLCFNAHVRHGQEDRTICAGANGILRAIGPSLNCQRMEWSTAEGDAHIPLKGCWFDEGFEGTMGELLSAVEEQRTPQNSAHSSLPSLALCFAALASADTGRPTTPGQHPSLPSRDIP